MGRLIHGRCDHLYEESRELSPVISLHSRRCTVVEAVHADILVVVSAEDLGDQKSVRKVPSLFSVHHKQGDG